MEGIFQLAPDGSYISVNPAMARIYGYESPEEMMSNVIDINSHMYVDTGCREKFNRLMNEQGQVKGFECQVYQKDGSKIWISENTRAVRDADGKLLYYEGIIQNITQRKQEEAALRRQVEELKIEIDRQKREKEVSKITQSDYFQELQSEVENIEIDEFWDS